MKVSPVRILLWVLVIVFLFALCLPGLPGSMFFGWFSFLQRVWPRVTVSWSGVGMAALCSALILAGLHSLCAWLFAAVAAKINTRGDGRWHGSWTVALYAGVWLLFGAIMGAVGVAHQVGWLIRSDEPVLKPRRHLGLLRYPLKEKSMKLFLCAEEARWDLETTRREFLKGEAARPSHPNVFEDLHVLFFEGTNGQLAGGLIFHRDPETRAKTGFAAISPETSSGDLQPIEMLPSFLARYQSRTNSAAGSADK